MLLEDDLDGVDTIRIHVQVSGGRPFDSRFGIAVGVIVDERVVDAGPEELLISTRFLLFCGRITLYPGLPGPFARAAGRAKASPEPMLTLTIRSATLHADLGRRTG